MDSTCGSSLCRILCWHGPSFSSKASVPLHWPDHCHMFVLGIAHADLSSNFPIDVIVNALPKSR